MSPVEPFSDDSPLGASGAEGVRALRVAVTRPLSGERLENLLRDAGHAPVHFPLTRIEAPSDPRPLARGARALLRGEMDVLLLTSVRAVRSLAQALETVAEGPWRRPEGLQVWVIGDATGAAAARMGLVPDRIPEHFVAEQLLEEASSWARLDGLRILFPRAAAGRSLLPETLARAGATVTLVEAYRSVDDGEEADRLVRAMGRGELDLVTLTAGSQARVLARAMRGTRPALRCAVPMVAIGPATRMAMVAAGLPEPTVAAPHTVEGVVAAVKTVAGGLQ
ncbi:MAG: uroporphyrinogen-III synthase [Gemmatimonadales bacterium]|nr:MAG: uroporphyrinogen-III synthase [Gemmatimonadales bacterium]